MAFSGSEGSSLAPELENERRLDSLFALQYRKSPLPDNRTANALVFIDGSIRCDALGGYLSHENLELIRLVASDEAAVKARDAGPEQVSVSHEHNFAKPQFVATILTHGPSSFRVHIFEPVSAAMTTCDSRLVEFLRALVTNLLSRLMGRRLQVAKESCSAVKWHMCVSCLMEGANIVSFLRHAEREHGLALPQSLNLPSSCQDVSFGPLLVLRHEEPRLHILRTLVSLELVLSQESSDFELELPICSEDSQDSTEIPTSDSSQLQRVAQLIEVAQQRQGQQALQALQGIINSGCAQHHKHTQNCSDCSEALCQRLFRSLDAARPLGIPQLGSPLASPGRAVPESAMGMRSNNKHLKCPLCNWTYKYRETREQHWREKHSELLQAGEADLSLARRACFHCRNNTPHPRLAKGEVYPCGFAAYHCHFCGYKTNTKGNLEIHKQSEKHLMNVQRHERHRGLSPRTQAGRDLFMGAESLLAANAQLMEQQQQQQRLVQVPQVQQPQESAIQGLATFRSSPLLDGGQEVVPTEFRDRANVIRCFVCGVFATGSLPEMMQHLQATREVSEEEYIVRSSDPQPAICCRLCPYRTGVKANFAVHCSTEKHRHKVSFLAHILSGDRRRLGDGSDLPRRLSSMSAVQLLCTACQAVETSVISMERHLASESHVDAVNILTFVRERTQQMGSEHGAKFAFECRLCSRKVESAAELIAHMTGPEHLQKITRQMPRSLGTSSEILSTILEVSASVGMHLPQPRNVLQCPCCTEHLANHVALQSHLVKVHFIDESRVAAMSRMATTASIERSQKTQENETGVQRETILLTTNFENETADALLTERGLEEDQYRCQECTKSFTLVTDLFEHQKLANHEGNPNASHGLLCWRKGCNQYFKTKTARLEHFKEIHACSFNEENSRFKHKCRVCGLFFADVNELEKHSNLHQRLLEQLDCSHVCTLCHAKHYSMSSLVQHLQDLHVNEEASTPIPAPAVEPLICRFCQISLRNAEEYRVHEKTPEHHSKIVAFALAIANSCNPPVTLNPTALLPPVPPLGLATPGFNLAALSSLMAQNNSSLQLPYLSQQQQQQQPPQELEPEQSISQSSPTLVNSKDNEVETSDAESAQALSARSGRPRASPSTHSVSPSSSPVTGGSSTPSVGPQIGLQVPSAGNSGSNLLSPAFSEPPTLLPGLISPLPLPPMPHSFPGAAFSPALTPQRPARPAEPPKRRGRTRISEEQLSVLRQHFHINSPPSDGLIREISSRTGLELKVIKHWYRNTLFKERQRDKDSPYNFSVPPSTSLNLEEYERTGRVEVKDARPEEVREIMETASLRSSHRTQRLHEIVGRKRALEEEEETEAEVREEDGPCGKRARTEASEDPEEAKERLSLVQLDKLMIFYKKSGGQPAPEQLTGFAEECGLSEQRVLAWIEKARSEDRHNLNVLADEQIVAVHCPYCEIIFRLRSQLADHLKGAHPDKPPVDPASLPDGSAKLGMSGALEAAPWISSPGSLEDSASSPGSAPRRSRTNISVAQSKLLRYIYTFTKSPSVGECLKLCHKLNLNRRVVQIWFQNRRALDKKRHRCSLGLGNFDPPASPSLDDVIPSDAPIGCPSCLSDGVAQIANEHLFSDEHLSAVHSFIETASTTEEESSAGN